MGKASLKGLLIFCCKILIESPSPLPHVSILANINVSLLANSKVDMVNVFEGGGGEEVERYCVIIIFGIHFIYFFRFSSFQKFYLAIKLTKVLLAKKLTKF